jgi:hypothetical protein
MHFWSRNSSDIYRDANGLFSDGRRLRNTGVAEFLRIAVKGPNEAKQAGRNHVVVKGADAYSLLETGTFRAPRRN